MQVTQKAEKMLREQHYNSELVRSNAENITAKWQQLMFRAEERMKLVMASLNWFKTAEQVYNTFFIALIHPSQWTIAIPVAHRETEEKSALPG